MSQNATAGPRDPGLHGRHLIGAETSADGSETFHAVDPRTGETLPPAFHEATAEEIDRALLLAGAAHPRFERLGRERRAGLLEAIAEAIEDLGPGLPERASAETGLPLARLEGERARTCGQLRLFAEVVREGAYLDARIDRGDPHRKPIPKPDVRSMARAIGPVAVFGASNFPLAFSVAGGDTAAALAAGCPVVVKAHPNHPGTSELVGRAITEAIAAGEMPEGVFSLVHGPSPGVGQALVRHPATRAVAFTGSLAGGRALFDVAAARPDPIPVYAEMGSVNPIFALPGKLATSGAELAAGLAGSVTLGVGQFCTNPGIVFVERGEAADGFVASLAEALRGVEEGPMLHRGIREAFDRRFDEVAAIPGVAVVHRGEPTRACGARGSLLATDAATFLANEGVREEVFGPSTLVVRCDDTDQMLEVARALSGQLTATIQAADGDQEATAELLEILEQKAGRVLYGGFPTGVEVCAAMVHGGPYPATTASGTTSVGTRAISRFMRPVAYQDTPEHLLPEELRDEGPAGLVRRVDGVLGSATQADGPFQ
ncbi:MAG TPA: aldehyde dehydrogenase (NADP(+)) [Thermoanaerobaculia bacterium]|nr:aldehyde dehydrogenase (NADP(+)) [Thermoanaerobaculia bacterium]